MKMVLTIHLSKWFDDGKTLSYVENSRIQSPVEIVDFGSNSTTTNDAEVLASRDNLLISSSLKKAVHVVHMMW